MHMLFIILSGCQPTGNIINHKPSSTLLVPTARPAVPFLTAGHHCTLDNTELYCLVSETMGCEKLRAVPQLTVEPVMTTMQV